MEEMVKETYGSITVSRDEDGEEIVPDVNNPEEDAEEMVHQFLKGFKVCKYLLLRLMILVAFMHTIFGSIDTYESE